MSCIGYLWDLLVGKIYITKERIKKLEFSIDSVLSVIANSKMPLVKVRFIACIIGVDHFNADNAVGNRSVKDWIVVQVYPVQS